MDKLIESLGIDVKILIAQLINFVVLIFILYKLGYKQILKFVQERTQKIAEGLKNAEQATETVAQAQKEQERLIAEGRAEGRAAVSEAKAIAEKQVEQLLAANAEHIAQLKKKNEADMEAMREQMLQDVRTEASTLIFAVAEKVLREKMDAESDKRMVEKYIAESK